MSEQQPEIEEHRTSQYTPTDETLSMDAVNTDGTPVNFSSIRKVVTDEGEVSVAQVRMYDGEGQVVTGEVQLPEQLTVHSENVLTFIERHKKAIRRVGAATVFFGAAAGIVVRSIKHKLPNPTAETLAE